MPKNTIAILPATGKTEEELLKELLAQLEKKGITVINDAVDNSPNP